MRFLLVFVLSFRSRPQRSPAAPSRVKGEQCMRDAASSKGAIASGCSLDVSRSEPHAEVDVFGIPERLVDGEATAVESDDIGSGEVGATGCQAPRFLHRSLTHG